MKCSKGCEGWNNFGVHCQCEIKTIVATHCPYCGSPLTEEPKMITRTVTYPEPVLKPLALGVNYYTPFLNTPALIPAYMRHGWSDCPLDHTLLRLGLVYPTADLAIQRAKAMIGE